MTTHTMNILVTILASLWIRSLCEGLKYEEIKQAFDKGLHNYSPHIRPVNDQEDTIKVYISFFLTRISSVRESEKTLQSTGFLIVIWTDQIMQNSLHPLCNSTNGGCPNGHEDIFTSNSFADNYLHLSPKTLWLPDLRVHNSVRKVAFDTEDSLLSLYFNGEVMWLPGGEFETFCDIDVRKFPFDTHVCHFDIGPWQSFKETLLPEDPAVDLLFFEKDGQWEVTTRNISSFLGGCCKYTIEIRRRPEIMVATMIVPTSILSWLGALVFKLPTESGERVSLSVSVTLALILYLSIIQNILPRSVVKPSYFEILLCTQVILNLFNVFINVINISIYHKMQVLKLKKNSPYAKLISLILGNHHRNSEQKPNSSSEETIMICENAKNVEDRDSKQTSELGNLEDRTSSKRVGTEDNTVMVSGRAMSQVYDNIFIFLSVLVNVATLVIFITMLAI